jgi:hypothetical protein
MRRTVLLAVISMLLAGFAAVSLAGPIHVAAHDAADGYFYHDTIAMCR